MKVFRLGLKEFITDLSGTGAKLYGGRWNSKGISVLYSSQSASLALLEFVCNNNQLINTKQIAMAELTLPAHTKFKHIQSNELPAHWTQYPSPVFLKNIGDNWVKENKTLALKVPSAIVPFEFNILINPFHKEFEQVTITLTDNFNLDQRLSK